MPDDGGDLVFVGGNRRDILIGGEIGRQSVGIVVVALLSGCGAKKLVALLRLLRFLALLHLRHGRQERGVFFPQFLRKMKKRI